MQSGLFRVMRIVLTQFGASGTLVLCLAAQSPGAAVLTYNPGSSVKLEQIIGDCDYQAQAQQMLKGQAVSCGLPTASQTFTRFQVRGDGQCSNFEDNGKLIMMCGDASNGGLGGPDLHGFDPIGASTTSDPEAPLVVNFFTQKDGTTLFINPPGIATGGDDLQESGISLPDGVYIFYHTGHDPSLADPEQNVYSLLVRFDENTKAFTAGRTVSKPGGVFTHGGGLTLSGSDVYLFGASHYRASPIYLQKTPAATFATGAGTQYFTGIVNGQPVWSNSEANSAAIISDPTVGNVSVVFSTDLNLWLMAYDAGWKNAQEPNGIYFTYASQPWGPWAEPQLIFESSRDHGYGAFIHDQSLKPCPPGDGLLGPLLVSQDPCTVAGVAFAPHLIGRFTRIAGNQVKIYYTMGSFNPYTVVKMRSQFTISHGEPVISQVANAGGEGPAIAPNTWVEIKGANLAPQGGTRTWGASDFAANQMPVKLDNVSVTVHGRPAYVYYISPTQINVLTPPDALPESVEIVAMNAGLASAPFTALAQAASPSFFVFSDNQHVAAVHANGGLVGPATLYPGSTTPAKPGESVSLYGNGFGPTNTPVVSGSTTQSGTLSPLPLVTVGGQPAPVQFAGLISPGLYQLNVVIPPSLTAGEQSVTASVNGAATQAGVVITVQR